MRRVLVCLLVVSVGAVAAACQGATPYAAIVNGKNLNEGDLLRELHALGGNQQFVTAFDGSSASSQSGQGGQGTTIFSRDTAAPTYTQAFTAIVLNTDIQAAIIHAEVGRRHLEPTAAAVKGAHDAAAAQFTNGQGQSFFNGFSSWFQHLYEVRTAEQEALGKALGPVDTSASGIQKFYRDNPQDFIATQCVSQIVVGTRQQAASIRAKLTAGASFDALARQYSTDKASASKGGSLGCAAPGQFAQAFEQAADTAQPGQVTQPVFDSQHNSWDLILITSRQPLALDAQLQGQIAQQLQGQNPISAWFQQQQKTLSVHINPAYGSWDPNQGVVPPTSPPPTP